MHAQCRIFAESLCLSDIALGTSSWRHPVSARTDESACERKVAYAFVLTFPTWPSVFFSSCLVCEIGGNWQYSCCFVRFCIQDLQKPSSWPSWLGLHLCKRVRTYLNRCSEDDTKQSYVEVPVMLELWGMWSTVSLSSLPGPLWPGMVAPDKVVFMGQIELKCRLVLNWITRNRTILIFKLRTNAKLSCLK